MSSTTPVMSCSGSASSLSSAESSLSISAPTSSSHAPSTSKSLYRIATSSTAGRHWLATSDIPRGTCIYTSTPLDLICSREYDPDDTTDKTRALYSMTDEHMNNTRLHSLYCPLTYDTISGKSDTWNRTLAIIQANAFGEHRKGGKQVHCLSLDDVSLINHSCWPTAISYSLTDKSGAPITQIYALCDIVSDTEITIAYHGLHVPPERRQQFLLEKWHFHCKCVRCQQVNYSVCPNDQYLKKVIATDLSSTAAQQLIQQHDLILKLADPSDPRWIHTCIAWLEQQKPILHLAHWRMHTARESLLLPLISVIDHGGVPLALIRRLSPLAIDHIQSTSLILPSLHARKQRYFDVMGAILQRLQPGITEHQYEINMTQLDPYYMQIKQMYA